MRDRREEILSRLVQIAISVSGIKNVYRNRLKLTASLRPAIVIHDGDEVGTVGDFALGSPSQRPSIMQCNPLIYLMAGDNPDSIGSDMSLLRLPMIQAVLADAALAESASSSGGVQYSGCTMDLGQGQTSEAILILTFSVHYPLLIAEMI